MNEEIFCRLCQSNNCQLVEAITKKPMRETNFNIKDYARKIFFCNHCKVYFNVHNYNLNSLYMGEYNKATYSNKIKEKYEKIMNIPFEKSDNKNRVKRILHFAQKKGLNPDKTKVLDVGSGLCVFAGELKKKGFKCYCIDLDPMSIAHTKENVGADGTHCGTLDDFASSLTFDIITFNKVLEHIQDPIKILKEAKKYLKPEGIFYIELPDANNAIKNGGPVKREEFFLEHYFVFNKNSFNYLLENAGLVSLKMEEIHEPSDKFTIFTFAKIRDL